MLRKEKEEMKERCGLAMQKYVDELTEFNKPLTRVDVITVSVAVTSADVTNSPADYYAGSVNQNKYVATFYTEEDATEAIASGDFTKAKTLTQFKYPQAGSKIAIDIS